MQQKVYLAAAIVLCLRLKRQRELHAPDARQSTEFREGGSVRDIGKKGADDDDGGDDDGEDDKH